MQQKITALNEAAFPSPRLRWLAWFVGGWIAFTVLPITSCYLLEFDSGEGWLPYVVCAGPYTAPWAQWSILTCLTILLRQTIWRRFLIFLIASLGFAVGWGMALQAVGDALWPLIRVAPLAASLVALPLFVGRVLRRWQIMHVSDHREPAPTSIGTYLTLMFVCGMLVSMMSWLPEEARAEWIALEGQYLVIFVSPLLAEIIIVVPLLRLFLGHRTSFSHWNWLAALAWLAFACLVAAVSPYQFALRDSPAEAHRYAIFGVAWQIAFSFWLIMAALWMRLLGYRLVGRSRVTP